MKDHDYQWVIKVLGYTIKDINNGMVHNHLEKGVMDGINRHLNELLRSIKSEQRKREIKDQLDKCRENIQTIRTAYGQFSTAERMALVNAVAELRVQEEILKNELACSSVPVMELVPRMQQGDAVTSITGRVTPEGQVQPNPEGWKEV